MAAKSSVPVTLTPLVSQGHALRAQLEEKKAERDAKIAELKAIDEQLAGIETQLIELGAGRYADSEARLAATVVAAIPQVMSPDTFRLRSTDDEQAARGLAGEKFLTCFDRNVFFSPKQGFDSIARAILTPAKARDLIALCIVPGQLAGGRKAHVRWK
jgi:hypothetical protein